MWVYLAAAREAFMALRQPAADAMVQAETALFMAWPEAVRVAAPAGEHPTAAGRAAALTPGTAPVSAVPVPAALRANAPAQLGLVPVEVLAAAPQVGHRAAAAPHQRAIRLPPIGPSIVQEGRKPALERELLGPPVPIWQEPRRLPRASMGVRRRQIQPRPPAPHVPQR